MTIASTCFPHKNIHKATWKSPDGHTQNQIDHVLIDRRHASDIMDVRAFRGADVDSDHYLVMATCRQRISRLHPIRNPRVTNFDTDKLKTREIAVQYEEKVKHLLAPGEMEGVNDVEHDWEILKGALTRAAEETLGNMRPVWRKEWFDQECREAISMRNEARQRALQRVTRNTREAFVRARTLAVNTSRAVLIRDKHGNLAGDPAAVLDR
ncbi:uncharacterized protein LOC120351364 [Nilaparvata lugens]|uniref:uncharacterized protein LOC120351364 n=1 Tax=Nilaparvata lugens TaxID=108931 RepID=UPI00193D6801|nr:uncharacterized protein LOC120351364 [Nilaparvata lugens]